MSNPQFANRSVRDIRNDIDYTRILIATLDQSAVDYADRMQDLQLDVQALEAELRVAEEALGAHRHEETMKNFYDTFGLGAVAQVPVRGQAQQRPHTSQSNMTASDGFAAYAGDHQNSLGGHFASDGVLIGHGYEAPSWSFPPLGSANNQPPDMPGTYPDASPGSVSSPGQTTASSSPALPILASSSRKRQRESLNLPKITTGHGVKSMRTTPSPALTGVTTPSSVESFDVPEDDDFFRLMGGNPKEHFREMHKEQKETERILRERREQEAKDAEIARQLMQQWQQEDQPQPLPESSRTFGGSSHLSRPTSQSVLDVSEGFRRPDPLTSSSFQLSPSSTSRPVKQERFTQASVNPPSINQGSSRSTGKAPLHNVSNFIDLGSDDDSDAGPGHPSSDLVEIDPASFHESAKKSKQRDQSYSTTPQSNNYPNTNTFARKDAWTDIDENPPSPNLMWPAAPPNPYHGNIGLGATNVYHNENANPNALPNSNMWIDAAGIVRQGVANTAKSVYNSAYSMLDAQLGTYLGTTPGYGGSAYGGAYGATSFPLLPQNYLKTPSLGPYGHAQQRAVPSSLIGNAFGVDDLSNPELSQAYLDRVNYLTADPTRTRDEIKSLLENIRPDEDLPPQNREGTPEAMKYPLMEHQKLGLTWMKNMEEGSNKGGILADDMGLGKTIQALALMVSRRSSDRNRKTTLIVAPVALMKQWEREIEMKLKPSRDHRLSCFILHGNKRNITWQDLKQYDVVLTTFGTLATELKRKEEIDMSKRANPNWLPTSKADRLPLLGDDCKWYRVIIDEAQCIKNKNTRAAKAAWHLDALTRFCMSGTPMMNNVDELYSLIHFLRIKPYNEQEKFRRDFSNPLKSQSPTSKDNAMRKLQALLKAILLRRTKKSKIDGQPILNLPERTTEVQHGVFSDDEEKFYRALESQTQLQFNRYLKAGTVGRNYSNVLVLLLRLRQACCHPHLIKDFGVSAGGPMEVSVETMIALAKGLAPEVVARIKEAGAIECPICMDSADNATIFTPCGHSTCSECFAKISDPSQAIAAGDGADRDERTASNIKCPNCRGKVDSSKVTDYNSFKKVHMSDEADAEGSGIVDAEADVETASDSDSDSSDDSDDSDDLQGFVVADDVVDGDEIESEDEGYRKGGNPFERSARNHTNKKKKSSKGKGKAREDRPPRKTLAQLKSEGNRNAKARRKYLKRLERDWETSAKIEKTMGILEAVRDRKEGEKTIIFSQFTSLLDLLEIPIARKDWGYRRYDGSMSSAARNDAVIDFTDKHDCTIMLVSLKAGNAGLNLVAASQVIIFDPFWNPYIEEQAIDRAHRIGQLRPVQVHRILVPNTVEDRILALQEKKRELIEGALDEKASQNIGRLGVRELAFLFGVPT